MVGLTYGALLGIFLLGLTTSSGRGSDRGNVFAMAVGTVLSAILLVASEFGWIPLGWTWIPILNTAVTYGIAFFYRNEIDEVSSDREGLVK